MRPVKFILRFLGSVEVGQHKGTEVLAQAINKVAMSRRSTLDAKPPPLILLEINEHGIKMAEKEKVTLCTQRYVHLDCYFCLIVNPY